MYIYIYGYGSIPINTIFRGMNIHLPAILMFTRGTRFWHTAIYVYVCIGNDNYPWNQAVFHGMTLRFFFNTAHLTTLVLLLGSWKRILGSDRKRWPSWTWTTQSKISIGRVATPTDMSGNPWEPEPLAIQDAINWICAPGPWLQGPWTGGPIPILAVQRTPFELVERNMYRETMFVFK